MFAKAVIAFVITTLCAIQASRPGDHHQPAGSGVVVIYKDKSHHSHHGHHHPHHLSHNYPPKFPQHINEGPNIADPHKTPSLVPTAPISIPPGFVEGRPACARELDLCVHNHDYPIEKVQSVIDRFYNHVYDLYHQMYKTPPHEVQWVENFTNSFSHEKHHGSFVCRSEAVYLRIGWAKNYKGRWMTVVNTERFPQVTRVEKCKYRDKPCDYMVPCYKSSCKQREMLYPLIALNPFDLGQKPGVDLFPVPQDASATLMMSGFINHLK